MLRPVSMVRNMDHNAAMAWHSAAAQQEQKITVVVLHEDPGLCHALRFALQVEGYRVRVHGRAQDYLLAPPPPVPAILLIDEALPDGGALEIYREFAIRGRALPAIMMATAPKAALRQGAVLTGIAEIVEKPLLGAALSDALKRLSLQQRI